MMFLKAVSLEGKTEFFNTNNILSIQPNGSAVKILMGAGLYWNVKRDSLEYVHPEQMLLLIKEGKA